MPPFLEVYKCSLEAAEEEEDASLRPHDRASTDDNRQQQEEDAHLGQRWYKSSTDPPKTSMQLHVPFGANRRWNLPDCVDVGSG